MERLTTQELEAIRKRAEKVTEGPWKVFEKDGERNIGTSWEHPQLHGSLPVVTLGTYAKEPHHRVYIKEDNAEFIANARTDIPKLLAEVETHRNEIEELTSMVRWSARRLRPFHRDFILNDLFTLTGVRYDEEENYGYSPTVSELQAEIERLQARLKAVNE